MLKGFLVPRPVPEGSLSSVLGAAGRRALWLAARALGDSALAAVLVHRFGEHRDQPGWALRSLVEVDGDCAACIPGNWRSRSARRATPAFHAGARSVRFPCWPYLPRNAARCTLAAAISTLARDQRTACSLAIAAQGEQSRADSCRYFLSMSRAARIRSASRTEVSVP